MRGNRKRKTAKGNLGNAAMARLRPWYDYNTIYMERLLAIIGNGS